MDKKRSLVSLDMLMEKDKKITELSDLIIKKTEIHQHALQNTINYYENILAVMPGHVYWLDRNNTYLGCNDNLAKQLRLASRHDIVGKKNRDLLRKKEQADVIDKLNNQIIESGTAYTGIETAEMADGEGIYFSQKIPLYNEQTKIVGVLGVSLDITELKKTEVALTVAKEHAEAANRAKIEFIANMSHDIRTPLSGVVGMSQLLKDCLTKPDHKQFAHWINQSGEQLLSLLNSILDVVSAENVSDADIRDETFDLRQCMDDIVQLERPTTLLKGLELNVKIDSKVPQHIITDKAKLHRILLNLIGNAIKFTHEGSILIEVKSIINEKEKPCLQFYVIDTGIGISAEQQGKVFERFFRVSSSYEGVYSGYGVGLHIAQSYVKLLGGELKFSSQIGKGTTFYFDIPFSVANVAPSVDARLTFDAPEDPVLLKNRSAYHLLLVEDNAIALRMVELIADQAGCYYSSAINGEDAYDLVKSRDFDLIITDIGLPLISGYELTRRIRAREAALHLPAIPIIGLTAHAHAKTECIQSGMNDVFCKPLNLPILESILLQYIDINEKVDCKPSKQRHGMSELDSQLFELNQFPILDINHAAQRLGNKSVLLEMLSLMATQEIPIDELCLHEAYAVGDWYAIQQLAHKMKGGAVYCGTFRMQYACQYLERYCKAGHTALLDQLYHQLLRVLDETKQAIANNN